MRLGPRFPPGPNVIGDTGTPHAIPSPNIPSELTPIAGPGRADTVGIVDDVGKRQAAPVKGNHNRVFASKAIPELFRP